MKFNLKKSKLLFEVRYKNKTHKDVYTYEMLYKRNDGKYFIHFEGGKYSEYSIKVGFTDFVPRSGNYLIDEMEIDVWKSTSIKMYEKNPEEYMVVDWEKEENVSVICEDVHNYDDFTLIDDLKEVELPF